MPKNTAFQYLSFIACTLLCSAVVRADEPITIDATSVPFEQLLQTEYIPASHIANQISNAASAVSIVTAQDIHDYGYQTLGEILSSMRGLEVSHDYEYGFLSGRAYSTPGEYAGRVIVLIDGYRADDGYFGQAFLGNDGILDVSMIERVEYIPGGSSSGYSNGALLGAINIITKRGGDIDGTQVAYGIGSHDSRSRRVTFGKTLDNGADLLFSVSDYKTDGRDFTYDIGGIQTSQNGNNNERNHRLFLKTSYQNLSLEGAYSFRHLDKPSYPSVGIVSDTPIKGSDKNGFVRLKYDSDLSDSLKFSGSAWYGRYQYGSSDAVSTAGYDLIGTMDARWYGGDVKLISTGWENHTLSLGSEYRHDYRMGWDSYYLNQSSGVAESPYDDMVSRKTYSVYSYDEWALRDDLSLNCGMRYEKSSTNYHALSPQAALIWKALDRTTLKLSVGKTNRQATPSEGDRVNPEKALLSEIVAEQTFDAQTKLILSMYRYRVTDRVYDNPDIMARGVEVELQKNWENGTRLHTSYAYQNAQASDGPTPINSPRHTAKFNLSVPLIEEYLRAGIDVQYLGSRPLYTDARDQYAPDQTVANLNLTSHNLIQNCDLAFKIRNLCNRSYGDVIAPQYNGDLTYPQDGRTFWLQLEYTFQ